MTTVVLHIGQHKTGTSTLQHSFSKSTTSMGNSSVVWLPSIKPNHSFIISSAFSNQHDDYHEAVKNGLDIPLSRHSRNGARRIIYKALKKSAARQGVLLVIAEDLCALHLDELEDMRNFFISAGATDFRICGYIRPCSDFVNSYAQQMIKQGFLLQEIIDNPPRPYYREIFEKFITIFGRDAFHVRVFEPSDFIKGSLIEDFIALAKLPIDGGLIKEVRANESISLRQAKAVSYLNEFFLSKGLRNSYTETERFLYLSGDESKFALTAEIHSYVIKESWADIDWVIKNFDICRGSLEKPAKTINAQDLLRPPSVEDIACFYHALYVRKKYDEASYAFKNGHLNTARARINVASRLAPENFTVQTLRDKINRKKPLLNIHNMKLHPKLKQALKAIFAR